MDRQHHQRALELFAATYELSEEARRELLDRECGDDTAMREEVESLLARDIEGKSFLEGPALGSEMGRVAGAVTATDGRHEKPGMVIGRYKLLQEIGEGGFGTVYMAEQTEPVQRKVALKVIKLGMDTKQVIARFEAERQALAMMDHPNVAKVLDAGATETGRPYFVMELVKGVPITEYCDTHGLSTTERLELLIDVCHSVQHAHQKSVIHRDIKPTNVLVTRHDGRPVPKIIDFGIAKATTARFTDKTMFTEFRQLIGTPAYMSPEQADVSGLDVDTRSDIYSLGVLLYELLTGTMPFDSERLRSASYEELQRIIREEEPDKPSTRLSSLVAVSGNGASKERVRSIEDIARHRRDEPARLVRSLRGDLDWIAMKCLEKDRSRRYETASGLAADIQRHLQNEPVEAGPPTAAYRVRKFVRRNRVTVTAATIVVFALMAGTAGTTFGLLRAEQRRAEAEAAREQTQKVSDFQAAMLSEIDVQAMGRGIKERYREQVRAALERQYVGEPPHRRQLTPEELEAELAAFDQRADAAEAVDVARRVMDEFVLARAAAALEEQFTEQPLVRARLHSALGSTYQGLGLYDAAETHLRAALDIQRRELGAEHPDTLTSTGYLGYVLWLQGKWDEAEPYYREAMEGRRRVLGDEHPHTLYSINDMGELLVDRSPAAAERYYREALEGRRRVLGDEHPHTLTSIHNIGYLLWTQGKPAEAEPYYREALEVGQRVMGNEYWGRLTVVHNLGLVLKDLGRFAEAEPYFREVLETGRRNLGDDHPDLLPTIHALGSLLEAQGKLAEAEPYFRDVLEKCRRVLGGDHLGTLASIHSMGSLLEAQGKPAEAEPYFREALEGRRRVIGDEHPSTLKSLGHTSQCLAAQGKLEDALTLCRDFIEHLRSQVPDGDTALGAATGSFGQLLVEQREYQEAEPLLRECLHIRESTLHPDSVHYWLIAQTRSLLGCALVGRGAAVASSNPRQATALFTEAEPLILDGYEWLSENFEQINPSIPRERRIERMSEAGERILWLYAIWHTAEPDAGHDVRAGEWRAALDSLSGP